MTEVRIDEPFRTRGEAIVDGVTERVRKLMTAAVENKATRIVLTIRCGVGNVSEYDMEVTGIAEK